MSYILDALQRSSTEESTDSLPRQPQTTHTGLALPWQIAIGAVLATNLVFLYLWQSDRGGTNGSESPRAAITAESAQPSETSEPRSVVSTKPNQDYYPPRSTSPDTSKKMLPGIASPRELPPPRPKPAAPQQQTASTAPVEAGQVFPGTAKTFRPTGAPITIAEPNISEASTAQVLSPTATPESTPQKEQRAEQEPATTATIEPAGFADADVSQLHELSDDAREALYVLNFSIHIYSEDVDLRAVVVNGKRLLEGNEVIAENGQTFRLLEIFDTGVVMQFEHNGITEIVEIPVNEEWKEA